MFIQYKTTALAVISLVIAACAGAVANFLLGDHVSAGAFVLGSAAILWLFAREGKSQSSPIVSTLGIPIVVATWGIVLVTASWLNGSHQDALVYGLLCAICVGAMTLSKP